MSAQDKVAVKAAVAEYLARTKRNAVTAGEVRHFAKERTGIAFTKFSIGRMISARGWAKGPALARHGTWYWRQNAADSTRAARTS